MKEIMLAPGEIIFNKGDTDFKVFIIREGEADAYLEQEKDINPKIIKTF